MDVSAIVEITKAEDDHGAVTQAYHVTAAQILQGWGMTPRGAQEVLNANAISDATDRSIVARFVSVTVNQLRHHGAA